MLNNLNKNKNKNMNIVYVGIFFIKLTIVKSKLDNTLKN